MCRDEICDIPLPSAAGISEVIPGSLREQGITQRYTTLSGWYIKFHPDTQWGYLYYRPPPLLIIPTLYCGISDNISLILWPGNPPFIIPSLFPAVYSSNGGRNTTRSTL